MAKVLVIDDSDDLRPAVEQLLRDAGHEVTATKSGADAISRMASGPTPDLVLLDLRLKGLEDGLDVLKALGPAGPPVVVMTGADVRLEDFAGQPVRRVVLKPFEPGELLAAVGEALKANGGGGVC